MTTTYVLWGVGPATYGGQPIKITAGTHTQARIEAARRKREGWSHLVIAPQGKRPWFPGDPQ